jgi:hypothetical protein
MAANYRCTEIKQEAVDLVSKDIDGIVRDCRSKIISDFYPRGHGILKAAVSHFEENSHQYSKSEAHS